MFMRNAKNLPRRDQELPQPVPDKSLGWYYYQEDKIVGPTNFSHLFTLPFMGNDERPILIRQSSQDKWYPISDISSLSTPVWRHMRLHVENERNAFITFLNQKIAQLKVTQV